MFHPPCTRRSFQCLLDSAACDLRDEDIENDTTQTHVYTCLGIEFRTHRLFFCYRGERLKTQTGAFQGVKTQFLQNYRCWILLDTGNFPRQLLSGKRGEMSRKIMQIMCIGANQSNTVLVREEEVETGNKTGYVHVQDLVSNEKKCFHVSLYRPCFI